MTKTRHTIANNKRISSNPNAKTDTASTKASSDHNIHRTKSAPTGCNCDDDIDDEDQEDEEDETHDTLTLLLLQMLVVVDGFVMALCIMTTLTAIVS